MSMTQLPLLCWGIVYILVGILKLEYWDILSVPLQFLVAIILFALSVRIALRGELTKKDFSSFDLLSASTIITFIGGFLFPIILIFGPITLGAVVIINEMWIIAVGVLVIIASTIAK